VSHSHVRWAGSLAAAGFCACGIGFCWSAITTPGPTQEQVRIETDLRLSQEQRQAKIDAVNAKLDSEWHFDRPTTWLRLVEDGVLFAVFVGAVGSPAALGWHFWRKRDMPDRLTGAVAYQGLTPELRIAINSGAMQTRNLLATNPALPAGLQHYAVHDSRRIASPVAEPEVVITNPADVKVPTLTELIRRREVGPGQLLALGWDPATSSLVRSEPTEDGDMFAGLYSAGMGGHQGSGKSRDAEWLCIQAALIGTGLRLCDGHGRISAKSLTGRLRPLEAAFIRPIALDHEDILLAMRETVEEIERRIKLGIEDGQPELTIVDEWRRVIGEDTTGEIAEHAGTITREGRKVMVNGLFISQTWSKRESGPFRNQLAAAFIHRMRPDEARMLVPGVPNDTLRLAQGECYVIPTTGETHRLWVPRVDDEAIALAGRMLASNGPRLTVGPVPQTVPALFPSRSQPLAICSGPTPSEYGTEEPSRARVLEGRVMELFLGGSLVPEIVLDIYGIKPGGGRPYVTACAEVSEVIRSAIPRPPSAEAVPALTILPMEDEPREDDL
jgi:hypothetical protein